MIRAIDRDYRQRLHERETELTRLRELVNEKDIVYRQQMRDRDHIIEALKDQLRDRDAMINEVKTRAYEMDEAVEQRIEKARNDVEDMWERRWKDYERLLMERVGLLASSLDGNFERVNHADAEDSEFENSTDLGPSSDLDEDEEDVARGKQVLR